MLLEWSGGSSLIFAMRLFWNSKGSQKIREFLEFTRELFANVTDAVSALQGSQWTTGLRRGGTLQFWYRYSDTIQNIMYIQWVASEDVETQRKGAVIFGWPLTGRRDHNWTIWINFKKYEKCRLVRLSYEGKLRAKRALIKDSGCENIISGTITYLGVRCQFCDTSNTQNIPGIGLDPA